MSTTWKQVVLDVADAWREANDSTAKIPVGELPNKVKEGGENIDPELTTLEGTLQEILEILPFKGFQNSGQYVWKRHVIVDGAVTNPKIKIAGTSPFKVTSDNILLEHVTAEFFGGFTYLGGLSGYYLEYTGGQLYFYSGGTKYTASYDPVTQTITSTGNTSSYFAAGEDFGYTGDKICKHFDSNFEFIVSNDSAEYPTRGEQDGYWYELMSGVSGVAIGEVITSSEVTSITIQHDLGEEPNIAVICSNGIDTYNSRSSYVMAVLKTTFDLGNSNTAQYGGFLGRTNTSGNFATITDTGVTFNVGSSYRFLSGKYKWVVAKV